MEVVGIVNQKYPEYYEVFSAIEVKEVALKKIGCCEKWAKEFL